MRLGALALALLAAPGCGSGLLGLNGVDLNSNGGNPGEVVLEPIAIFVGTSVSSTITAGPGSTFLPSGFAPVSASQLSGLVNPSNTTTFVFTTPVSCATTTQYEELEFVFDVESANLPSHNTLAIQVHGAAVGEASSSEAAPTVGGGTIAVFNASGSGAWFQPSNAGLSFQNESIVFTLNGPFGGWQWSPSGGPDTDQFLVVAVQSNTCDSTNFSSIAFQSIQLTLQ
jgi:hypothetical protein